MKYLRRSLAALAVIGLLACGLVVVVTQHVEIHRISTGSMQPVLPVGSFVVTSRADTLQKRDIITFVNVTTGKTTTHTFIGYDEKGNLLTKGDANPTPDVHYPPLTHADVRGVLRVHTDVFTVGFWATPRGVAGAICLLVLGYLVFTSKPEQSKEPVRAETPALNSV